MGKRIGLIHLEYCELLLAESTYILHSRAIHVSRLEGASLMSSILTLRVILQSTHSRW